MYGFYSKEDKNKEIIFKVDSPNISQATTHFSFLKQLDKETFNKLYQVIKL